MASTVGRTGLYETHEDPTRPKYYFLTMLPYPSGDLHIGHWYAMAPSDARARYMRMQGYNVFFPIGFDAFGLPAENAAIKHGIHPYKWTMDNIERDARATAHHGRDVGLGSRGGQLPSALLHLDRVVLPEVLRTRAWPIENSRRWTFAPSATPPWRANRCGATTATASAAARRSSRKSWTSGSSRSPTMPMSCWTSPADRLARARPHHADQLDRPQRGRGGGLPVRGRRRGADES